MLCISVGRSFAKLGNNLVSGLFCNKVYPIIIIAELWKIADRFKLGNKALTKIL